MMMEVAAMTALIVLAPLCAMAADVSMEKVEYGGWPNCVRLTNGETELIVTTDVGPRVIRYGFVGGQNLFKEYPETLGKTGGDEWHLYGGHRLWHAPEAKPRTYFPDNTPVKCDWDGKVLKLSQPVETTTGIEKQIEITLAADANHVTVVHRLINRNAWDVTLAPWALSVMAPGGRAVFPQEKFISHEDFLLPARPLVLWHYTDMADPRWSWGEKYIQLSQDPKNAKAQKIGLGNSRGWAAYLLKGDVFIKRFPMEQGAEYPDFGCNNETFTNEAMLEVESVGPMTNLAADEGVVEHVENWFLFKEKIGKTEKELDEKLAPLVAQTEPK